MAIDPTAHAKSEEGIRRGKQARLRDRALELAVNSQPGEERGDVVRRAEAYFDYLQGQDDGDE